MFSGEPLKIARIDPTNNKNISSLAEDKVSKVYFETSVMDDIQNSYTVSLITNQVYHAMWGSGLDFENMGMVPKYSWKSSDKGLVVRFNTTKKRELFESRVYYGN